MIFTFMQMYYLFMHSRLNINKNKIMAKFGLMHLLATNCCIWIRTLVRESVREITESEEFEGLADEATKTRFRGHGANVTKEEQDCLKVETIPHICHLLYTGRIFKFQILHLKITKIYPKTRKYVIFLRSIWKNLHLTEFFTRAAPVVPVTNMRYAWSLLVLIVLIVLMWSPCLLRRRLWGLEPFALHVGEQLVRDLGEHLLGQHLLAPAPVGVDKLPQLHELHNVALGNQGT